MLRVAVWIIAVAFVFTSTARAQAPYGDEKTPTGWAWARIQNDEIADFGKRCGELDPHVKTGWDDPCRQIPPRFLVDVLTAPKWRDQLVRHRVRLRGVRVDGRSTSPTLRYPRKSGLMRAGLRGT